MEKKPAKQSKYVVPVGKNGSIDFMAEDAVKRSHARHPESQEAKNVPCWNGVICNGENVW